MTEPERLNLVVLEAALEEIVDQADYYELKSGQGLAARWDAAVHSTIQSLRAMAHRGAPCYLLQGRLKELRRIPVKDFERMSIFYRVAAEDHSLIVVAVLHTARDIVRILETPRS